jgi:PKD repeat protein
VATYAVTPPVANFSGTPNAGNEPLTVAFTDSSTNTPTSWLWDFGDLGSSILQNPSHIYAADGVYTVKLTATNAGGSDDETKVGYITVANVSDDSDLNANTLQAGGFLA